MPRALWPFLADCGAPCGCSPRFPVVSAAVHPPGYRRDPGGIPPQITLPQTPQRSRRRRWLCVGGGGGGWFLHHSVRPSQSSRPTESEWHSVPAQHTWLQEKPLPPPLNQIVLPPAPLSDLGAGTAPPGFKINSPFPRPQPSCPEKALPGGNTRLALLTDSDLRGTVFQVRRQDERLGRPPLMKPRKEGK